MILLSQSKCYARETKDEQKRTSVNMAKQLLKKYPKYQKKKLFDSLITGDETWVQFYEPKRKVDNRIWAMKHAKRRSIAKQTLTEKVLYTIFFPEILGHSCKLLFQKVGVCLVNVVLKKKCE